SSLYNAYDRNEVKDKLVFKIDQDGYHASKFSVANDISEVYGLSGIHEYINGQKALRAIIDIDTLALYRILNYNWKDILNGLVITTSSDPSKCSYHILYALVLLINHHELKAFTKLVYTITDQDVLQKCAKLVLQNHSNYLRDCTIEEKDLKNFVYFNQKGPLECLLCKRMHDKDQVWFNDIYVSSGTFIVKCFQQDIDKPGEVFECDSSITEKIRQENKNFSQLSHKVKVFNFPKAFVKFSSWIKYNKPLTATEIYEKRYIKLLSNESDIYVRSPWKTGKTYILENLAISDDVNLLILSMRHSYSNIIITRLNFKSYCDIDGNINLPDYKRVVCQIESLHRIINNCKYDKKCKSSLSQYDLWLDEIVSIIAQA
ncbi:12923_t:CDS:2, partial [Funneliformis geosporum]